MTATCVRPRVVSSRPGATLPNLLEELVERWLEDDCTGIVALHGAPGSGKTTALAYLAERFASDARLVCIDDHDEAALRRLDSRALVVSTLKQLHRGKLLAQLTLAPWGEDEWIEYLLARPESMRTSVLRRLRATPYATELGSRAELCTLAIDRLAEDDSLPDAHSALTRHFDELLGRWRKRQRLAATCLRLFIAESPPVRAAACQELQQVGGDTWRILRHVTSQTLLAAEALVRAIERGRLDPAALGRLTPALEGRAATLVRSRPKALKRLRRWLEAAKWPAGGISSLLHSADPKGLAEWLSHRGLRAPPLDLVGARLQSAHWQGLDLSRATLDRADLRSAQLRGTLMTQASAVGADFSDADLEQARLEHVLASHASFCRARLARCIATDGQFSFADLECANIPRASLALARFDGAKLSGADLHGTNLQGATFTGAILHEVDFRSANLDQAGFRFQDLRRCDLAGASLRRVDLAEARLDGLNLDALAFESANLRGAHLTGASLRGASLARACLVHAHLAQIDAEGADLRDADLGHASFHMGSSRSGLVFNAMPMEGSRTGFYTDDYFEQPWKRPEEVRKANLQHADLRGARVEGTDFYLVDLRGARFTPEQHDHFLRCGAILGT